MILYRAMCFDEFSETMKYNSLSWISSNKWFSDDLDFIKQRVKDGKFNNSKFVQGRYDFILEFDVKILKDVFVKCGYRELMLNRKNSPFVRINKINIYET